MPVKNKADIPVATVSVLSILSISLLLQHEFSLKHALLFLIGVGLGITLLHALFGFTGGWRQFIRNRDSKGVRAQILLLALTSIIFFPVIAKAIPGISGYAAMGPVGISVLAGAFLFGMGMQLGGGCGSGTLFTVGWGHIDMLITLTFFIVGATLGAAHLPWWTSLPALGKISIINEIGWMGALLLQLLLLFGLYLLVRFMDVRKNNQLIPLRDPLHMGFFERLTTGPWPLSWGIAGLLVFNFLTLWLAGHPWSITFAFGLWGTKIWSALGGDISSWSYWASNYPSRALNASVLKDTTSIMDFGIIFGAALAAALAGKFAPQAKINRKRLFTAIAGGLLLGYGARLAYGCNIGAMLAGISTGSLHGWLWLVSAFCGSILAIRFKIWIGVDAPPGDIKQ